MFTIRTKLPNKGNKFYNTTSAGGYSHCIVGKPTVSGLNVLCNCVGWACGRFNEVYSELTGYQGMKYWQLNCNAEDFITRGKNIDLKAVSEPVAGGIMVWQSKGSAAGHVAFVEMKNNNNQVYTSESGYGNFAFANYTRNKGNGNWGLGSSYKYLGCLINPAVKDTTIQYQSYDNKLKMWLPKVKSQTNEFAGDLGNSMGGIRIYGGYKYRVHLKGGSWLDWVTKADSTYNGYAGIYGKDIDGVQIYNVTYRVHIKGEGWLSWVNKVDNTYNGYAGIYGKVIDAIQIK